MELNEKIRALRLERGMTLEEVGNLVGVGKSTVRKWESGDIANMRRDKIAKLAVALGTSPAYLMGWEETDTKEKPPVIDEGPMAANTVRIVGRDGSYVEKRLSDDQVDLLRRMIDQLPDYND